MSDQKENERQLEFWTAPPVKYGLPMLIAAIIVTNIITLQQYLFAGKPYDWSAASILVSMLGAGVYVHFKVKDLKNKVK